MAFLDLDGTFPYGVAACEVDGHSVFLAISVFCFGWEASMFFNGVWWMGHLAACCTLDEKTYLVPFRVGVGVWARVGVLWEVGVRIDSGVSVGVEGQRVGCVVGWAITYSLFFFQRLFWGNSWAHALWCSSE